MTFLPIVDRELRVAARQRGTYWTRPAFALLAICIFGWIIRITDHSSTSAEVARWIFQWNSVLALVYCLMVGAWTTSDCVSEEKREGTLGLLFLTDLKAYDVVLGKMAATSLRSLYGLVAIFPVLAIPLLLGGVLNAQVIRTAAVLLNTLFMSLSVGVLVSTLSRNDRRAAAGTFTLIAVISLLLPLAGVLIEWWLFNNQAEAPLCFYLPSPIYTLILEFRTWDPPYAVTPYFWTSLITGHLIGWICLGISCRIMPTIWQDKPATTRVLRWSERWRLWCFGSSEERMKFRSRLLDVNPIYWLTGRNRLAPMLVWLTLGMLAAIWMLIYVNVGPQWLDDGVFFITAIIVHLVLKMWVASESCRQLAADRQSGALELLLSTPVNAEDLVSGQMLALRRQFGAPIIMVVFVDALFMIVRWPPGDSGRLWGLSWLALMITLVADCSALGIVSMRMALTKGRASRAFRAALFRIIFLPVLISIGASIVIAESRVSGIDGLSESFFLYFWFILGFAVDAVFGIQARGQMVADLRNFASERFYHRPESRGWWPFRGSPKAAPDAVEKAGA